MATFAGPSVALGAAPQRCSNRFWPASSFALAQPQRQVPAPVPCVTFLSPWLSVPSRRVCRRASHLLDRGCLPCGWATLLARWLGRRHSPRAGWIRRCVLKSSIPASLRSFLGLLPADGAGSKTSAQGVNGRDRIHWNGRLGAVAVLRESCSPVPAECFLRMRSPGKYHSSSSRMHAVSGTGRRQVQPVYQPRSEGSRAGRAVEQEPEVQPKAPRLFFPGGFSSL